MILSLVVFQEKNSLTYLTHPHPHIHPPITAVFWCSLYNWLQSFTNLWPSAADFFCSFKGQRNTQDREGLCKEELKHELFWNQEVTNCTGESPILALTSIMYLSTKGAVKQVASQCSGLQMWISNWKSWRDFNGYFMIFNWWERILFLNCQQDYLCFGVLSSREEQQCEHS